jgi:hypothetical protein
MLAETVDAVIGIDTHRDNHEVEIADAAGRPIATIRIGNDSAGSRSCLQRSRTWRPGRAWWPRWRAAEATAWDWRGR